jgi:hypothetical protein
MLDLPYTSADSRQAPEKSHQQWLRRITEEFIKKKYRLIFC